MEGMNGGRPLGECVSEGDMGQNTRYEPMFWLDSTTDYRVAVSTASTYWIPRWLACLK